MNTEWKKCEEGSYPEKPGYYLCYYPNNHGGMFFVGKYLGKKNEWEFDPNAPPSANGPSYWCNLPDKPSV